MARKSTRGKSLRKYWKEVHGIARDKGLSIKKARKACGLRYWKVVFHTEPTRGRASRRFGLNISVTDYVIAKDRNEAIEKVREKVADYFERDKDELIPLSRIKGSAFKGYEKKRGLLKWKHGKGEKFQRVRL